MPTFDGLTKVDILSGKRIINVSSISTKDNGLRFTGNSIRGPKTNSIKIVDPIVERTSAATLNSAITFQDLISLGLVDKSKVQDVLLSGATETSTGTTCSDDNDSPANDLAEVVANLQSIVTEKMKKLDLSDMRAQKSSETVIGVSGGNVRLDADVSVQSLQVGGKRAATMTDVAQSIASIETLITHLEERLVDLKKQVDQRPGIYNVDFAAGQQITFTIAKDATKAVFLVNGKECVIQPKNKTLHIDGVLDCSYTYAFLAENQAQLMISFSIDVRILIPNDGTIAQWEITGETMPANAQTVLSLHELPSSDSATESLTSSKADLVWLDSLFQDHDTVPEQLTPVSTVQAVKCEEPKEPDLAKWERRLSAMYCLVFQPITTSLILVTATSYDASRIFRRPYNEIKEKYGAFDVCFLDNRSEVYANGQTLDEFLMLITCPSSTSVDDVRRIE